MQHKENIYERNGVTENQQLSSKITADGYLYLQLSFLRALQSSNLEEAWSISETLLATCPDHPGAHIFQKMIRSHRNANNLPVTSDTDIDVNDSTESSSADGESTADEEKDNDTACLCGSGAFAAARILRVSQAVDAADLEAVVERGIFRRSS